MHKYRMSFLSGLATGYVLGTRSGRERYEQMKKVARTVADSPAVQQAAGAVQAQAAEVVSTASTKISEGVRGRMPRVAKTAKAARGKVEERVPGLRRRNGQGGHAANGSGNVGDGRNISAMSYRDGNSRN